MSIENSEKVRVDYEGPSALLATFEGIVRPMQEQKQLTPKLDPSGVRKVIIEKGGQTITLVVGNRLVIADALFEAGHFDEAASFEEGSPEEEESQLYAAELNSPRVIPIKR